MKAPVKPILAVALIWCAAATFAQNATTITAQAPRSIASGSVMYIDGDDKFATYLAAALQKKNVPVLVTTNKAKADFVIKFTDSTNKAGWAKMAFTGSVKGDAHAAVTIINKDQIQVWSYAVDRTNAFRGEQTAAESVAKHLGEYITKGK